MGLKFAPYLRLIGRTSAVLEVDAGAVPLHVAHVGGVLVLLLQRILRCIFEIQGISGKFMSIPTWYPVPRIFMDPTWLEYSLGQHEEEASAKKQSEKTSEVEFMEKKE